MEIETVEEAKREDEESKLDQQPGEEGEKTPALDDLLAGFESDLSIEDLDKEPLQDFKPKVNLAVELNILRNASSHLLDEAARRRVMMQTNISCDKYLQPVKVLEQIENTTKRVSVDFSRGKLKGNFERHQSKEQFKAMQQLDKQNERASPR